ncbi:MAG: CHAD domain-containing protein [Gemmatimonadales bacterium]
MTRLALTPDVLRAPTPVAARMVARSRVLAVLDQAMQLELAGRIVSAQADPREREAVHDFRVALRRLRSWLRACRPVLGDTVSRRTRRRVRRLAHRAGRLRDLEVEERALSELRGDAALADAASWLTRRLRADARRTRRRLMRAVTNRLPQVGERMLRQLAPETDGSRVPHPGDGPGVMAPATAGMLRSHVEVLRLRLQEWRRRPTNPSAAHATRIALKRLRYLLEAFGDSSDLATAAVERLGTLQDALGRFHDAQLLQQALSQALKRGSPPPPRAVAALRRAVSTEMNSALAEARSRLGKFGLRAALKEVAQLETSLQRSDLSAAA